MQKPTLYLMMGYPGAGKTTVSEYILKFSGAVHLNSDQFRLRLFKNPLHITEEQHESMYKLLDHITERILKSGQSVVYDANLNKYAHRQEKYDIAKRTGAKSQLVWVKTDQKEAKLRATINALKHPGHRPFGNMDKEVFERLVKQMEPPKKSEKPAIINGNEINSANIKKILTKDQ